MEFQNSYITHYTQTITLLTSFYHQSIKHYYHLSLSSLLVLLDQLEISTLFFRRLYYIILDVYSIFILYGKNTEAIQLHLQQWQKGGNCSVIHPMELIREEVLRRYVIECISITIMNSLYNSNLILYSLLNGRKNVK